MKARRYFLLTALSGMIGMLALITTHVIRSQIAQTSVSSLSDQAIDQLQFLTTALFVALTTSQITIAAFVIFLILYLISKNRRTPAA